MATERSAMMLPGSTATNKPGVYPHIIRVNPVGIAPSPSKWRNEPNSARMAVKGGPGDPGM
jgi:hypothetical protein